MRWFVEISRLGSGSAGETLCVEAAKWQPALQAARTLRGDSGDLSGFSIELLDDGYRAVDATTRIAYLIRKAPDGTPLTAESSAAASPTSAKSPASSASSAKRPAAKAPPSSAASAAPSSAAAAKPAAPKADAEPARSQEPAQVSKDSHLPPFRLLRRREDAPTETSKLTYREYSYAVAPGVSESVAEALLFERLAEVRAELAAAPPGKFVNLAIFDHVFEGRPKRRPLATLSWKDWNAAWPEIRFPLRDAPSGTPSSPPPERSSSPSFPGPIPMSAPPEDDDVPFVLERSKRAPAQDERSEEAWVPMGAQRSDTTPIAEHFVDRTSVGRPAEKRAEVASREETPRSTEPRSSESGSRSATSTPPGGAPRQQVGTVNLKSKVEMAPAPRESAPSRTSEPTHAPKQAAAASAPRSFASGAARDSKPEPPKEEPAAAPVKAKPVRHGGEDLLSELFEAFSDLHFRHDSLEGAEFVLTIAQEKLPCEIGFVWLFDINRREYVIVRQAGGTGSGLLRRLPERSPIPRAAMRSRRAVVIPDASVDDRIDRPRYEAVGIAARSIICAPVELAGRYLGLVELVNPEDGKPFTEEDGNALTYIGQQYAEFVAAHGVVVDAETVAPGRLGRKT